MPLKFAIQALKFLERLLSSVYSYPILSAVFAIIPLIAFGAIGGDWGLEGLFWYDSWLVQGLNGVATFWLFGSVLFIRYLLGRQASREQHSDNAPSRSDEYASANKDPHIERSNSASKGKLAKTLEDLFCKLWRTTAHGKMGRQTKKVIASVVRKFRAVSLFPSADAEIRNAGKWLFRALTLVMVLLLTAKVIVGLCSVEDYFQSRRYLFPLLIGYIFGGFFAFFLAWVDEQRDWRSAIAAWGPAWLKRNVNVPAAERPLHRSAAYLGAVIILLLVAALFIANIVTSISSIGPFVLLSLVLTLFVLVYGFLSYIEYQYLVLTALMVVPLFTNRREDKLTVPGLEGVNPVDLTYRKHGEVEPPTDDGYDGYDYQFALAKPLLGDRLIASADPIEAAYRKWKRNPYKEMTHETRPPLIIVCCSGGGIRAAVWTSVVLEGLDKYFDHDGPPTINDGPPTIRQYYRLFTGASGGMLAAAQYVADFERDLKKRGSIDEGSKLGYHSRVLAQESLSAVIHTLISRDIPSIYWPLSVNVDRGRTLEDEWIRSSRVVGHPISDYNGKLPLERTFGDLRALERIGERPSIIFSPILVEDSRRLLISNLDLHGITTTSDYHLDTRTREPGRQITTRSSLEFFRLFPESCGLKICTAARLNATFPYVTPAVSIPTIPPRSVIDAGYNDNFGVETACLWLRQNKEVIMEKCSGVLLIQIRAYRSGFSSKHIAAKDPRKFKFQSDSSKKDEGHKSRRDEWLEAVELARRDPDEGMRKMKEIAGSEPAEDKGQTDARELRGALGAYSWLLSPFDGLMNFRRNSAIYRNGEILEAVMNEYNSVKPTPNADFARLAGKRSDESAFAFFATTEFELEGDMPLNWYLSEVDKRHITEGFYYKGGVHFERNHWIDMRLVGIDRWIRSRRAMELYRAP